MWQPPISISNPLFKVIPPLQQNVLQGPPQVTQFLQGPTPPPLIRGRGVPTCKDSAKYLGAVTRNSIPPHIIRQQDSLEKFCDLIKKWKPDCKCKLCKDYIGHIGYIQIVEQFPFIQYFLFHSSYYSFIFNEF